MCKKIRKRMLPLGWYPETAKEIKEIFEKWGLKTEKKETERCAVSAIVPHAGWYYSGESAFNAFSSLCKDTDTVVIAGGHLSKKEPPFAAEEEEFCTGCGTITNDKALLAFLAEKTTFYKDHYPDNTVEINLPIIKYFFPKAKLLWLRLPPNYAVIKEIAQNIVEYEKKTGNKIVVAGSTDLTHYGNNYSFSPKGGGEAALRWVKDVNDKEFIDLITNYKIEEAIEHSIEHKSACSSGAAAFAAQYAYIKECKKGELLRYHTSYDISPADSFVGYAAISFSEK